MPGAGHGLELEEKVPRRLRSEGRSRDIFCMVKQSMSDDHLIQPPILVYPEALLPATSNFFNNINNIDASGFLLSACLDEGRCQELLDLAENIEKDFPHLQRGVAYLRSLTNQDRQHQLCPRLKFIDAGPSASHGLGDLRLGPRPCPPKPHKLQVVFHHRQAA